MEMHQIRYFLALSRTLNFTRAAEECNVTQPTLTRAVQKLEDELGGPLFNRERNLTHLTELGRLMLPHLEQTFAAAQAAKELARSFRKLEVAPLTLGLSASLPPALPMPLAHQLDRKIPGFEFTLVTGPAAELIDRMLHGGLDALMLRDGLTLPDRLHRWILFGERTCLALPHDHELARQETVPLAALDGRALIERPHDELGDAIRMALSDRGITVRWRHHAPDDGAALHMVAAGLGVALVPAGLPLPDGVVLRPLADAELPGNVLLTTVAGRRFSPALDAFVKLARARAWEPEPLQAA